jgi:alkaline phosphatase
MVADGMSLAVPSLAEPFSRLVRGTGTRWHALLRDPRAARGFFDTSSLSSLVTDSAAASTAWASGSRVFNGALNVLPDGQALVPIARLVRETGRRIGLVTTTTITHATPAGFASVQKRRDEEPLIAPQYLDVVDVLLGGGRPHFDGARRSDQHDLRGEFAAHGYALWDERAAVCGTARPAKVLGLFANGHLPYTIDHRADPALQAAVPTLAEMTQAALEILAADERGFLLQVEGGRVDHAAHGNDAAAMLWDQLAFDDALAVVLAFAERAPDTLVIVTADHATANPGLNGMGGEYRKSTSAFARLGQATCSLERLQQELQVGGDDVPGNEQVSARLQGAFGLELPPDEVAVVRAALAGQLPTETAGQHRNFAGIIGQLLGNHTAMGWTGVSHTQDCTLVSALGPGAEDFAGLLLNTDAFSRLSALLGLTHRNPRMTVEQAGAYLAAAPQPLKPDWVA